MFQDVSRTWSNVQSEHERYMLTISEVLKKLEFCG